MKLFIVIFIFCVTRLGFSQETKADIMGLYYMPSGNPEGGTSFVVMPNHTFVVAYFGGMLKGNWELKNGTYYFTYHTEPKFVLYGRTLPEVKDSIRVRVGLDGNRGFALRFNPMPKMPFTPLFNTGSNCYSYPYVYKQAAPLQGLDIYPQDQRKYYEDEVHQLLDIYSFRMTNLYNDFILSGLPDEYTTPRSFTATFKNNMMFIDGEKGIKKRQEYENINEEDKQYLKSYVETDLRPKTLAYGNELFPYYEHPTAADLIPFTRIEPEFISSEGARVLEGSLFIARCED